MPRDYKKPLKENRDKKGVSYSVVSYGKRAKRKREERADDPSESQSSSLISSSGSTDEESKDVNKAVIDDNYMMTDDYEHNVTDTGGLPEEGNQPGTDMETLSSSDFESSSYEESSNNSDPDRNENDFIVIKDMIIKKGSLRSESEAEEGESSDCQDEDEETSEEEEQKEKAEVIKLYKGSKLTKDEAIYRLMTIFFQTKGKKTQLKKFLNFLNECLPEDSKMPKSLHLLFKDVKNRTDKCPVTVHFFCDSKDCAFYLGPDPKAECLHCKENTTYGFFFEIDLEAQIKHLLEVRGLSEVMKKYPVTEEPGFITDITSGSEYKRVNVNRQEFDLTLILNTDGLKINNSHRTHCWPLMHMIAEVPPELRESFLSVCGLWCCKTKPVMNTFLEPFKVKFQKLYDEGVHWKNPDAASNCSIKSRVIAPVMIADAPGRADVQNIQGFRGDYACNMCEIKQEVFIKKIPETEGKEPKKDKRKKKVQKESKIRYFPFREVSDLTLRTKERMAQHEKDFRKKFRRVIQQRKLKGRQHVKGVKGKCTMSEFPFVDRSTFVLPEYMHSGLIGEGKNVMEYLFEKKGPWKIKKSIKQIDKMLFKIKPPNHFARMPRSIAEFQNYKANEVYAWIVYYSIPIFKKVLSEEYFQHWLAFSYAIYLLLQRKISLQDINLAERLLEFFVENLDRLYDKQALTYNSHQLLHLPLSVRRWGPLWATSAFPFESFNGKISSSSHATNNIGMEIVNNLQLLHGYQALKMKITEKTGKYGMTPESNVLGKEINFENDFEKEFVSDQGVKESQFFARAKIFNEIFTSTKYKSTEVVSAKKRKTNLKTDDYTVGIILQDGTEIFGKISFYLQHDNELCFVLRTYNIKKDKTIAIPKFNINLKSVLPVEDSSLKFLRLSDIKSIYNVVRVEEYLSIPPNLLKMVL